jgi:hypothetical protein
MTRKLHMAIAVGAFVASALPAAALEDIRAPLSSSGGQSERIGGASISSANDEADELVVSSAPRQFLFVPDLFDGGTTAPADDDGSSNSLSPSGGRSDS